MKKRLLRLWNEHRKITIAVLVVSTLLLSLFGTQLYLYLNFLLGNNVVVKLDVSPLLLQVVSGEQGVIRVEASVTTNPFCSASCTLRVVNLARDTILVEEEAVLRPGISLERDIAISVTEKGHGTMPVRVELGCAGIETFFCHTTQQSTSRNLLVMVEYALSAEDQVLKNATLTTVNKEFAKVHQYQMTVEETRAAIRSINKTVEIEPFMADLTRAEEVIRQWNNRLLDLEELWNREDYGQLAAALRENIVAEKEKQIETVLISLDQSLGEYGASLLKFKKSEALAANLSALNVIDTVLLEEIKHELENHNLITQQFNNKTSLWVKSLQATTALQRMDLLWNKTRSQHNHDVISRAVDSLIIARIFCHEKGSCLPTVSVEKLAQEDPVNAGSVCTFVHDLRVLSSSVKSSLEQEADAQQYPATAEFAETIKTLAANARQVQRNGLLTEIPATSPHAVIFKELLPFGRPKKTTSFPQYDLVPAVLLEVLKGVPEECQPSNASITITPVAVQEVAFPESGTITVEQIRFEEPPAQCCINNKCMACCTDENCRTSASYYPIVFLHGHAFNKDTSYEYSLDSFNGIQQRLERDGFVSAGAVSLYTKKDLPYGEFGLFNVPMTIKASYYVDLFQTPENYVVVQTKSENIDVYALRLKEILDTVQFQTGRPKVIIVAHSMGGLVARRYLQIFGASNVAKLITIGTPHQGVEGDVAEYCDLVGEQRECNDMNANSVFMNKLKTGKPPAIPVATIIGTGCEMDGEQGDGIVLEKNGKLEGSKEYLVKGMCSTFSVLHTQLLDIYTYPGVYDAIKAEIKME
ncbi:alpha/beta fold hydrolase [Candidatus Woesearchaeota archaeon]|nr:alpha/beta fold hydrolase [Candidatus Woesearchaeota archaeon]